MTEPMLPQPSPTQRRAAHEALMRAFEPVRVAYGWTDGPFGQVFIARSATGLCRVSFRQSEEDLLAGLERHGLLPEPAAGGIDRECRELEEYFDGKRTSFDLPLDLRWGTPFQRQVLEAASAIPFGKCECYTDVASRIGRPRAQRAVGNALGKNPIAIVIPCHRVVGSGGSLGGYTGGLDIKRTLMGIEGIEAEKRS